MLDPTPTHAFTEVVYVDDDTLKTRKLKLESKIQDFLDDVAIFATNKECRKVKKELNKMLKTARNSNQDLEFSLGLFMRAWALGLGIGCRNILRTYKK